MDRRTTTLGPVRTVALLANPGSGGGEAERAEEHLRAAGADVVGFPIGEWTRASRSGADRIAVAGGDGSIGCAAAAAQSAGVPLAVIGAGTANDFVAAAGLPDGMEEACALAARGETLRPMELGRAGGRPFVNVASVGLAPAAAEHADGLKDRLGALAYPLGATRAAATEQPIRCRVTCDGGILHDGEAWQVSVACMGAFGGGSTLETNTSDGKLDLIVIEGSSRIRLAKHAYGLRVGAVEQQEGVIGARCGSVELDLLEGGESLNVDGELVEVAGLGGEGTIHFTVERAAFELVVG